MELNQYLDGMLTHKASDLYITVGAPICIESMVNCVHKVKRSAWRM